MFSYQCVCLLSMFCALTVLVNCLLNAFAICVGEVTVFSLNVIVLFLGCVLLANSKECIPKSVCVVF